MSVSLRPGKRLLHRLLQRRLLAGLRGVGDRAAALVLARVARGGIEIRVPRPAQAIYDMMQMHLCGLHVLGCGGEAGVLGRRADFLGDVRIGGRRRGRDSVK